MGGPSNEIGRTLFLDNQPVRLFIIEFRALAKISQQMAGQILA